MAKQQISKQEVLNRGLTLDESVREEIERLRATGELGEGYKTVSTCYVCCELESQDLVNKLISAGLTNREIADSCAGINTRRVDEDDPRVINAEIVWRHKRNHFNVDAPAQAVYRAILERRAEENKRDHVNGVGHAVTPYAVIETVMTKGYGTITNPAVSISPKEAIDAAVKLHELTSRDASTRQMADLLTTMDRIITAAQKFIPVDKQEAFLAEVEGRSSPMQVLSERVVEKAEKAVKEFVMPTKVDPEDAL